MLIPIIAEQFLNSLMGMADSMMVSNVGAAALSGVSLVDSINNLVVQAFAAMATGGVIICHQYIAVALIPPVIISAETVKKSAVWYRAVISMLPFFQELLTGACRKQADSLNLPLPLRTSQVNSIPFQGSFPNSVQTSLPSAMTGQTSIQT